MSKSKSRGSGFGKFLLGTFIGFLLTLALIGGVGAFAYFNLSANWVNGTFKTDINLGSEELNKKTLKDFVAGAISLASNIDTYTITKLNQDFGIDLGDEIMGIDITDLKDVKIPDLGKALENKFSNISAEDLKELLDLSGMDNFLNKTNTYYINNGLLYKNETYSNAVDFEYSINANKLIVKGEEFNISENKVDVELRYLPLVNALPDFVGSMGDKITVGELESNYGVKLPAYLTNTQEKKEKTINELETIINDLTVADIMGYTLGLDGKYYSGISKVEGIMAAIAGKKVDQLSSAFDSLKLSDVFDSEEFNSGALSILKDKKDSYVKNLSTTMSDVLKDLTINDLHTAGVVTLTADQVNKLSETYNGKTIGEMLIVDVVVEFIDSIL